ncbi:hypothetical protein TIFTF001_029895 [Ficus carica]|uniref:Uncharacterized protein n=1 Tax=Ficus carica TaxID=3494 RepID=A0AA88DSL4_FICCA|nr:hypothetical protein TIFTF001_029895 [Ficus carica]
MGGLKLRFEFYGWGLGLSSAMAKEEGRVARAWRQRRKGVGGSLWGRGWGAGREVKREREGAGEAWVGGGTGLLGKGGAGGSRGWGGGGEPGVGPGVGVRAGGGGVRGRSGLGWGGGWGCRRRRWGLDGDGAQVADDGWKVTSDGKIGVEMDKMR